VMFGLEFGVSHSMRILFICTHQLMGHGPGHSADSARRLGCLEFFPYHFLNPPLFENQQEDCMFGGALFLSYPRK